MPQRHCELEPIGLASTVFRTIQAVVLARCSAGASAASQWRRRRLLRLTPLLIACGCSGAADEDVGGGACTECRLVLDPVTTLESADPAAQPLLSADVDVDSRGRYVVVHLIDPGRVARFDSGGAVLFGRRGGGPGEFEEARRIAVGPGDSIYLAHDRHRVSLFGPDLQFVRTWTAPYGFLFGAIAFGSDGALVSARSGGTSGYPEHPLRVFSAASGEPRSPMGSRSDYPEGVTYADVAVSGDTIWALHRRNPIIDVFTLQGDSTGTLTSELPWFPESDPTQRSRSRRGVTMNIDLSRSRDGLLWVLTRRVRREAQLPPPRGGAESMERSLSLQEVRDRTEYLLHVVEPTRNRVLLSASMGERLIGGLLPDARLYGFEEDSIGALRIRIWQMRIEIGKPSPQPS